MLSNKNQFFHGTHKALVAVGSFGFSLLVVIMFCWVFSLSVEEVGESSGFATVLWRVMVLVSGAIVIVGSFLAVLVPWSFVTEGYFKRVKGLKDRVQELERDVESLEEEKSQASLRLIDLEAWKKEG